MNDLDIGIPFNDSDAPPRSRVAKHRRRRQRGRDRGRSFAAFTVGVSASVFCSGWRLPRYTYRGGAGFGP